MEREKSVNSHVVYVVEDEIYSLLPSQPKKESSGKTFGKREMREPTTTKCGINRRERERKKGFRDTV